MPWNMTPRTCRWPFDTRRLGYAARISSIRAAAPPHLAIRRRYFLRDRRAENRGGGVDPALRDRAPHQPLIGARRPARERNRVAGRSGIRDRALGGSYRGPEGVAEGAVRVPSNGGGSGCAWPDSKSRASALAAGGSNRSRASPAPPAPPDRAQPVGPQAPTYGEEGTGRAKARPGSPRG